MMQVAEMLKPPPVMTVSQWADAERRLSPESSAEPGRWYTSRAEYSAESWMLAAIQLLGA